MHSVHYDLRLSPFKNDLLALKLGGGFSYTKVDSKVLGRVTHFQAPMYYELTFNYKNFSAYYQGAIPCKGLSIPMIYDSELSSAIGVRYKYKDWAFQLSCDNFLTNPESHYHSIENSIVRTQGTSYVKNAWNRVMLKINFRFGKGKQYQEPVRKTVEEGLWKFCGYNIGLICYCPGIRLIQPDKLSRQKQNSPTTRITIFEHILDRMHLRKPGTSSRFLLAFNIFARAKPNRTPYVYCQKSLRRRLWTDTRDGLRRISRHL